MSKKGRKLTALLLSIFVACGLAACTTPKEQEKTGAEITQTEYNYDTTGEAGITLTISFHDAKFIKLTKGGEEVDETAYRISGSLLSVAKNYLDGLGNGTHSFAVVTDLGEVPFQVIVSTTQKQVGIDDLIDETYYQVVLGEGNGLTKLPSADEVDENSDYNKYIRFKEGNKSLTVGESFTINFGTDDFWSMRLRPYNMGVHPSSLGENATTAFRYITDDHGTGMKVTSSGLDYPSRTDGLKLKGSSFLNGASYELSVTYRCGTQANASYWLAFHGEPRIVTMDGAGVQTKTGSFTVSETLYLTGDHTWYYDCLYLYIDCAQAADITVYSLTLTRTA